MTFKEFYWYSLKVEENEEREWQRTSHMMWLMATLQGGKKMDITPDTFNPFSTKGKKGNDTPKDRDSVIALKERIAARNKKFNRKK